jgi:phosphoglycerate dehydrogenase-like enzyme
LKVLLFIQWPVKAWTIPDAHAVGLAMAFPDVEFVRAFTLEEAARAIVDVDAAFTPRLTADMIAIAPQLRWVHSPAAAVEGLLPLAELRAAGITVTNSKGIQAIPIAEHVMGGVLLLLRAFDRTIEAQREQRWIQHDLALQWPRMLYRQRMTIVGLGTIGLEIAKRAHAFGVHVTGVRRHPDRERPSYVNEVVGPDALDDALRDRDIVVLSAPGVSATQRMIGAQQLALLNRGALLVNVARAGIVDPEAMRAALEAGQLGGAVLDVFEHEPLAADDPLWSTPNVIITPHSAGFRATHWDAVSALFSDNLRRFRRGEPLHHTVDLAAGY